ncbi:putative glycerophosphodiester phosphodiesterase, protein kinase RLK-Pelle-LRK10L-2 family [Helianthus annuus]|nr:putative glycerophosphodiester phosphodiesterase, protein kinase RLK-Pelle-LRK10L-2 family [Helianthus annuus]KAJ0954412.1 putative glycerophosphodiester phosphodiesterase, protein kinase RLK-Pelle-LRK10L-2 family [Helianthus annuus]
MFLKFYILAGGSKSSSLGIVLGIVGAVIAVVGIGCGIFVCRQRKKTRPIKEWVKVFYQNPSSPVSPKGPEAANNKIEIFIRNYGNLAPKRYKYSEIEKMTNSFQEKLGHGGYGSVYRGQLHDGHQVAVKLLSEATGDGEDFINEVASIGRTSHVNIVTLLGFCFEGKKRALLYKFMPNGSLDKFLRGDGSHLDWNTLFQIAKGIARGLEYLHKGCNTRIVHFDIKPHNILLDEEFVPKISDFGLAKLCKTKESIVSVMGARGTAGYMAPEVFFKSLGGASHKSDVYSYGMMVLEMTGARKHNNTSVNSTSEAYFPDWVCWLQAPNPTHSQHTLTNCL